MKPIQFSEDVYPIGRFKTQASHILNEMRRNHRPVMITQNGRPAGVLITPEYFDKIRDH